MKTKIDEEMRGLAEYDAANIVPIRLSQGGKFGPDNWLADLPLRTHFVAQTRKGWTLWLEEYTIMGKEKNITLLREDRREGLKDISDWKWTDNEQFSLEYKLRQILHDDQGK